MFLYLILYDIIDKGSLKGGIVMDDNRVAVILEDLRSQFKVFGEGLQMVNDKIDRVEQKVDQVEQKLDAHIEQNQRDFEQNRQEHKQLMQMINELDNEVQVVGHVNNR